jgi:hypothetical protein
MLSRTFQPKPSPLRVVTNMSELSPNTLGGALIFSQTQAFPPTSSTAPDRAQPQDSTTELSPKTRADETSYTSKKTVPLTCAEQIRLGSASTSLVIPEIPVSSNIQIPCRRTNLLPSCSVHERTQHLHSPTPTPKLPCRQSGQTQDSQR